MDSSQTHWTLSVEGMEFYSNHGLLEHEKYLKTHFVVDVFVGLGSETPGLNDRIEQTLNYSSIYSICKRVMDERKNLIEVLAKEILDALISNYPAISNARVKVCKIAPPFGGKGARSCIEVTMKP
jgi:dihydroneopterin aldolase